MKPITTARHNLTALLIACASTLVLCSFRLARATEIPWLLLTAPAWLYAVSAAASGLTRLTIRAIRTLFLKEAGR